MRNYAAATDKDILIENMDKEINFYRALLMTTKEAMRLVETTAECQALLSTLKDDAMPLARAIDDKYQELGVITEPAPSQFN